MIKLHGVKGFTLVEIIVTMAILGILLGIAFTTSSSWLERYKVAGQTKQIYADLMNARASAMQSNRVFFVTIGANQYSVYEDTFSAATGSSSPDGDGVLQQASGQDRLVMQKNVQYTINFSCVPPAVSLSFFKNGLVSCGSGAISITSTSNPVSDCIAISDTRIHMGKMDGSICTVQ